MIPPLAEQPQLEIKHIKSLPEAGNWDGCVETQVIRYAFRPIVIVSSVLGDSKPPPALAMDYYCPAIAARLGLVYERCVFILHERRSEIKKNHLEPAFDDRYRLCLLDPLERDFNGWLVAGNFRLKELGLDMAREISRFIGQPLTQHKGKLAVAPDENHSFTHYTIEDYDGSKYYTRDKDGELQPIKRPVAHIED